MRDAEFFKYFGGAFNTVVFLVSFELVRHFSTLRAFAYLNNSFFFETSNVADFYNSYLTRRLKNDFKLFGQITVIFVN